MLIQELITADFYNLSFLVILQPIVIFICDNINNAIDYILYKNLKRINVCYNWILVSNCSIVDAL